MKKKALIILSVILLSSCTVYRFRTPVNSKEEFTIYIHYKTNKKGAVVKSPAATLLQSDTLQSKAKPLLDWLQNN